MTGVLVVTHLLAAAVGALCAGAWMRWHRMAKRRAVRELQSESRSALDLECTQFSHEWGLPV